jgi:hypothetical protein
MILPLLALGASSNALPASAWSRWTAGYSWRTHYGQTYVEFPPLFGHQYSHVWIDFRHVADAYMKSRATSYFENSRRATLAQRAYCIANPSQRAGYSSNVWGLTACDGPNGYSARGAPPAQNDDGTIAPTAAGGSIAFAPDVCLPVLEHLYATYRRNLWTPFGFRDAFNPGASWWGPDTLGIDQGPIVLMIENYRTQRVWQRFMRNPEIQRGLQRAGFTRLLSVPLGITSGTNAPTVRWPSTSNPGRAYQLEYSADLHSWFHLPTGPRAGSNVSSSWSDIGPPDTASAPGNGPRFYRIFQLGTP